MSGALPFGGLVRTSVRLRIALLRGALRGRGGTARLVMFVIGTLFGALWSVLIVLGLAFARGHGTLAQDLAVLLFCSVWVFWVVLPVVTFASDDLLDPSRLALFPLAPRELVTVMGVGALVGVPAALTLVVSLGLLPAAVSGPGSAVVAVLAVPLQVALCVASSRAATAALSGVLRSRRGRDLGVLLVALLAVGIQVVNAGMQGAMRGGGAGESSFHGVAGVLGWTPPGLLAAAPGRSFPAGLSSLFAVAAVVVLLVVGWERAVRRAIERTDASTTTRRTDTGLLPRRVPLPPGRTGAVAAQQLRYVMRDPRRTATTVIPIVAVGAAALPLALAWGGIPPWLVFVVAAMALIAGLNSGNRFGMDGSATWLLVASSTDPRDARRDLAGSDLASVLVLGPLLLAAGVVIAAVAGGWGYLPHALGLAYGILGTGLGLSALSSVLAPFAVPPTVNSFGGGGAGQGLTAIAVSLSSMAAQVVLCIPLLGLLAAALLLDSAALGLVLLVAGPLYGAGVRLVLLSFATARWRDHAPEVLRAVTWTDATV